MLLIIFVRALKNAHCEKCGIEGILKPAVTAVSVIYKLCCQGL
jgi:hypothetical protein